MNNAKKVLVIDDDDSARALIKHILNRENFDIECLEDGQQAKQRINTKGLPDLILLDLMMPYCNGFEVMDIINKNKDWTKVPVILLTGRNDEKVILKAVKSGFADYVVKPFKTGDLVNSVKRCLH